MNDSGEKAIPRRTVLEFRNSPSNTKKIQGQNKAHVSGRNLSLEIQCVIKAVESYGRKTHSIGAMQGACAIQNLIDEINALGPHSDDMQKLLRKGTDIAAELKSYMKIVYEEQ